MKRCLKQRGLTLVELALVLLIVGLVSGGGLMVMTTQMEQNRIKETQRALALAKEALIGYAQIHGRLPCPVNATSNGQVPSSFNPTNGICPGVNPVGEVYIGYLPASTLGIGSAASGACEPGGSTNASGYLRDGWNRCIRYAVTRANGGNNAATRENGIRITGISVYNPNVRVCRQQACPVGSELVGDAVAVVFSTGKNGPGASADEAENLNNNFTFVMTTLRQDGAPGGAFDDIVEWLPRATLINAMIAAQKLP